MLLLFSQHNYFWCFKVIFLQISRATRSKTTFVQIYIQTGDPDQHRAQWYVGSSNANKWRSMRILMQNDLLLPWEWACCVGGAPDSARGTTGGTAHSGPWPGTTPPARRSSSTHPAKRKIENATVNVPRQPVLRIHDILVWIRIRGSIPLTKGSGSF
jgi:hypothetical protein